MVFQIFLCHLVYTRSLTTLKRLLRHYANRLVVSNAEDGETGRRVAHLDISTLANGQVLPTAGLYIVSFPITHVLDGESH